MENFREELFKISSKSICHGCKNIEKKCSLVTKVTATDSRIGKAYVMTCTKINKDFEEPKSK